MKWPNPSTELERSTQVDLPWPCPLPNHAAVTDPLGMSTRSMIIIFRRADLGARARHMSVHYHECNYKPNFETEHHIHVLVGTEHAEDELQVGA